LVLIFSIFIYLFILHTASSISPKDQEGEDAWLPSTAPLHHHPQTERHVVTKTQILVTFTVIIMGTTMLLIKELVTNIHHISEQARVLYCTILKVASKNVGYYMTHAMRTQSKLEKI
jgi:UDP-N-acetylmuramyl pentapeptide phosphotransferase/UDP-N-acetylglucosamine-1-phosphate transferase